MGKWGDDRPTSQYINKVISDTVVIRAIKEIKQGEVTEHEMGKVSLWK